LYPVLGQIAGNLEMEIQVFKAKGLIAI